MSDRRSRTGATNLGAAGEPDLDVDWPVGAAVERDLRVWAVGDLVLVVTLASKGYLAAEAGTTGEVGFEPVNTDGKLSGCLSWSNLTALGASASARPATVGGLLVNGD
eukprot:GILK01016021.1.p2 GENE.GILK01016021.1~~GILK01016021.1.p2  ORF type:complete len:108 (-),score=1.10 GILK01016021.1:494-817(-)